MNQTTTAVLLSGEMAGRDQSRRRLAVSRVLTGAVGLWGLQFAVGLTAGDLRAPIRLDAALVSLVMAAAIGIALSILARRGRARGPAFGGLAAAGMALVHLVSLESAATTGLLDWRWAGSGLACAILLGASLCWAAPLMTRLRGGLAWTSGAVASAVLVHLLLRSAVVAAALSPLLIVAVAGVAAACVGLLIGGRMADLSVLASAESTNLREQFRVVAEALPIPIVLTPADNERILFANERSRQQFFVPPGNGRDLPWTDGFYTDLNDRRKLSELVQREGAIEGHEVEMRRADGSTFWALIAARAISFNGQSAILTGYYDITDRKAAEEALLASEVRYALISRAANDGIWDWDIPSGTVYYSARWKEIVGAEPGKRLSTLDDWLSRVHPDDVGRVRREIDEHVAGRTPTLDTEYRIRHGDGRYCWMQCRGIVLRGNGGEPIRMAGSQSDITLRKTYEINLRNAAYEDRLTGITNRAYFTHLIDTRNTAHSVERTAILLFNVDQFRRVNDSLGSGAGDALLVAIARRLAARIKPADGLSRLGGDEFAVWLQDVSGHQEAMQVAEAMLSDLAQPYALGDAQMPITISAGAAATTLGGATSGADLFKNARLALDRAKQMGGGQCMLFDEELLSETKLRQRLSRDLSKAERLGQIFFEYQPVVALEADGTNRVAGFEALMRWRHPELGLIPPGRFIPLAEEAGLIGPLGLFAIESAAREIIRWTESGLAAGPISVAVNLSARQISDRAGVSRLLALLDRLVLPAGRLKLEITESVLMRDPEAVVSTFHELRRRGVGLSLDDFGTGYSSLSYLHRFPLDVLKIDRSFVTRMSAAPEALRLVRSIIELAHDLGLAVVAEGVESPDEAERLRGLGCDYAQGYLFSRPVPAEQAEALLVNGAI